MAIKALDHVQLAMPVGREDEADAFYHHLLGFAIVPKPPPLAARGGRWYAQGDVHLHLGVDFTGGTVMELRYTAPPNLNNIRDTVARLGFTDAAVQNFGTAQDVLVATDCLSEGVNLQEHFQAVVHYDLAWNPTRHEQREGRVDRFGQQARIVRAVMLYGADNGIDGIVLDVLLRKHEQIRKALGDRVGTNCTG